MKTLKDMIKDLTGVTVEKEKLNQYLESERLDLEDANLEGVNLYIKNYLVRMWNMKKLNKKIINKLNELMLRGYPGTPILETYTQDQKSIIEQVYIACNFSSPFGDASYSEENKTQSLIKKTKDLEKQAYLQSYRKQYYTKMFDIVLKYYGL
ncbi:putative adhesin P54 [Spiroplasma kunkelii CR2-3x]|uniref:Putative adhesin P54 n=1 Tax=Spiroplasma kunkelii CR2-3x TaxID=273035 RepID=A0A0K2JHG4_SPIKU|nr:hypothetical protein [Spiroplasma kunkelii]ALA98040.1 putative adhesin P54 [Spiroplasma kunkelii CR2-3x]